MSDVQELSISESIFGDYVPSAAHYDEVFTGPNEVRPSWGNFLGAIGDIGQSELMRRWLQAQEDIHETGIAYNVYDESAGAVRPWELDLLPQFIPADEWSVIASGVKQRATLLNRILVDLYGPQVSLTSGLIPAEWLFSHPGFRRVFHGQEPHNQKFLQLYAVDLARAPDGRWWVVSDRTDAPLGLGYALENRVTTSRMLPTAIRRFNIARLSPFFKAMQKTLNEMAPSHRDNPRIVLLSHGPSGPNYFEDAYLARYLGYTLVEGGDLAVRDDHVYLKTLGGLLPVDVILRRMSDEYSDPLALRGNAGLGVAGLLQCARLGNVAIANSLGSSLVESPSLSPFLPGIARKWLGEELELPSVATWWCGQRGARENVLARIDQGQLDGMSIQAAYRVGRREAVSRSIVRETTVDELAKVLQENPHAWIGQEAIQRSTSPIWCDRKPEHWHVGLRVFLVATKDSYEVLPGGLVRLDQESSLLDASVTGGHVSKDTWVQTANPVKHESLLSTVNQPVGLRRSGAELPSRVADNLFWFGRRVERAQGSCRLLRPVVTRLTGEGELDSSEELACLIRCLAAMGQVEPGFAVPGLKDRLPTIANILPTTVVDENHAGSVRASVVNAHRNASLVRDRLSLDSWRIVQRIERVAARASEQQPFGLAELDELTDDLIVDLSALDGLIGENMTRSPAWRFLDLGRRLERALSTALLVQSIPPAATPDEARALEAALEVADSVMTYRGRYLAAVSRAAALDLLLTDETNPRSLVYQLTAIHDHVSNLPGDESRPLGTPEGRIASSLLHSVRLLDVDDLSAGDKAERTKLGRMLQSIVANLPKLSDLISHRYLIHAGVPRQMGEGNVRPTT